MRNLVADTLSGKVRGHESGGVLRFLGVPYGADTGGDNRFRPPQQPTPWAGVRDADKLGPIAMQVTRGDPPVGQENVPMSEECLALNVWTPSLEGRRPVLVWIHGGGFTVGRSVTETADGAALARSGDVVVVSMNHRLGLLGFLNLDELAGEEFRGSGNASMLDLVAALEWVRDNIETFGGDPTAVTIFGHSGGGSKVAGLMSMPSAAGLFRSAAIHGGPPFGFKDVARSTKTAEEALHLLDISPTDAHRIRELPVSRLLKLQEQLGVGATPGPHGMRFAPSIGTSVMPVDPYEAFAAGVSAGVPLLIGTALDEARYAMFVNPEYRDSDFELDEDELVARVSCGFDNPPDVGILLERYRAGEATPASAVDLMFDVLSDQFRIRTVRLVEARLAGGGKEPFLYLCEVNHDQLFGSFHGVEMPFFFDTVEASGLVEPRPEHPALAARISGALVEFARSGTPLPDADWPSYGTADRTQLVIGDSGTRVESDALGARRAAWAGILATPRADPWARLFA